MAHASKLSPLLRDAENPTFAYVGAFVDELQRAGIRDIVVCPGSRSTPLALAIAAQPGIHLWMHVDERSAAFFALGLAKRSERPVALLCTSGSAAANFFPAIVEAKLTHVPLLILTADRPHELRENGAPQTIDQIHLYGTHVKWSVDVALPEATNDALRYIRTLAGRATALSTELPVGPVHLNFPLREPLTPAPIARYPLPPKAERDEIAWLGRPNNEPYVSVYNAMQSTPDPHVVKHLAERARMAKRGLILVGPQQDTTLLEPLVDLARHLGFPILADPLSRLRSTEARYQEYVLTSYDAFLRLPSFTEQMAPDLVLRFGAMPTAKPVLTYLKRYSSSPLVVIDAEDDWSEPTQLAAELIHADSTALCKTLNILLAEHDMKPHADKQAWLSTWQQADNQTRQTLQNAIVDFSSPFEGRVFTELAQLLPENALLYVGNSMPVRDMDTFFWSSRSTQILGNRGANGIDGIVSSALGASALNDGPAVLVIGDLSFFHDMNGLLAAKLHALDLTIVVVNNDGGGIFSFLPQADYPEHFEQLFGTPIGLDFEHVAALYNGHYQQANDWQQFRNAVENGMHNGGLHLVEVKTERESNVTMHRQLWRHVEHALAPLLGTYKHA